MTTLFQAQPGSTILVPPQAGPLILPSGWGGTAQAPIVLRPHPENLAFPFQGIKGLGVHHLILDGFTVDAKNSPLKNGIQIGASMRDAEDFSCTCEGITIQNCKVSNAAEDGIKLSQTDSAIILGNLIRQSGQQAIDLVDCRGFTIQANIGIGALVAAVCCVKGGSSDGEISRNIFTTSGKAAALEIGGFGDIKWTRPDRRQHEASRVRAFSNTLQADAQALLFTGAYDCQASGNSGSSYSGRPASSYWAMGAQPDDKGRPSELITVAKTFIRGGKPQWGVDKGPVQAPIRTLVFVPQPQG